MSDHDALSDLVLAQLLADAAQVHLPQPRAPRRVIDLTVPSPRTIVIPDAGVDLVEGYADYGV